MKCQTKNIIALFWPGRIFLDLRVSRQALVSLETFSIHVLTIKYAVFPKIAFRSVTKVQIWLPANNVRQFFVFL
jgi:hypothetical protein